MSGVPMTAQAIFEKVATHLFNQGKQAMLRGSGSTCAYRTAEGLSCAVGCVIDDEHYAAEMEESDIGAIIEMGFDEVSPGISLVEHRQLLRQLQDAHDTGSNWSSTEVMRDRLIDAARLVAAETCGLDYAFLDMLSFSDR